MALERKFEFLEHTADVYIAAYGRDLMEAFENAAAAAFEVMTDVDRVEAKVEEEVEVEAEDEYALLYSWIEELLVRSEINQVLYSRFKVLSIEETDGRYRLRAKIWGEEFNPDKHTQKVGIKAITYHQMEIIKEPGKAVVKFILDI